MAPALALKALTQLHSRNVPAPARAPLTTEQRNVNRVTREEKQDEIDLAVQAWFSSTVALAEELATKHSKKPRHFLDLFFHGGAKMLTQRSSTNSWNAWSSITAEQENGDTDRRSNLIDIQEEQHHEYLALTQEAKDKLVHDFDLEKGQRKMAVRISSRGRIQDVSNAARNIELILQGLRVRVGIEGFFVIARASSAFHMAPHWYFTSPELEEYMGISIRKRWNTEEVGLKIEAFALAGSKISNMLTRSKDKADYIKGCIREKINTMLIEITGTPNAVMQYVKYETEIVHKYGVELTGWTHDTWANPSELTSSIPPLQALLHAIESGACKFVKLNSETLQARLKEYHQQVADGKISLRKRKQRSDKGTTKRRAPVVISSSSSSEEDSSSGSAETGLTRKQCIGNPVERASVGGKQPKSSIMPHGSGHDGVRPSVGGKRPKSSITQTE